MHVFPLLYLYLSAAAPPPAVHKVLSQMLSRELTSMSVPLVFPDGVPFIEPSSSLWCLFKGSYLAECNCKVDQKLFQSPNNPTSPRNLAARFVNNPALSKSWSINLFMMKNWKTELITQMFPNVQVFIFMEEKKKTLNEWLDVFPFHLGGLELFKHSPLVCFFSVSLAPGAQICLSLVLPL